MTLYLDTSDLVKLYVEEPGADVTRQLAAEADVVATSALAYPEARAAFARRRRDRGLTVSGARKAIASLDEDWPRFLVIPVSNALGRAAGRLADKHGIRGCDAVHLASFERLLEHAGDDEVRFACADARLTRAARSLG